MLLDPVVARFVNCECSEIRVQSSLQVSVLWRDSHQILGLSIHNFKKICIAEMKDGGGWILIKYGMVGSPDAAHDLEIKRHEDNYVSQAAHTGELRANGNSTSRKY